MFGVVTAGHAMTALTEQELSVVDGQALLNLQNSYDQNQSINFHKMSIQALMELNLNVKSLQLGCGGDRGAGCDIDISNIALSGLNTGTITDNNDPSFGSPTFDSSRAATSASITNPFLEFAIKGDSAATREVVGFRLGAESIIGLLTLGTDNTKTPNDGIQSFSGYMKIAQTQGDVTTKQATFGDSVNEQIEGYLRALLNDRTFTSDSTNSNNTGITVPSMKVGFSMPETIVTGVRKQNAEVKGIKSKIEKIPLAAGSGVAGISDSLFENDQLFVRFPAILGLASSAKFKMANGSIIKDLNMDITFNQALSMIHNVPLTGTGGYLSMQKEAVKWADTDTADIAQPGWWLSFKNPVQLGYLQAEQEVDISAVLPQVATLVTQFLTTEANRIQVNALEAIGSLLSVPISKKLEIDLGNYTVTNPATITLSNEILKNQKVTSNCFGNYKFC